MEPTVREKLRQALRTAVHRACWHRREGDAAGAEVMLASETDAVLAAAGVVETGADEIVRWREEDAADFDHAMLIGELVSRRLAPQVAAPAPAEILPRPLARPPRARAGVAPEIADMLDEMLAQERGNG